MIALILTVIGVLLYVFGSHNLRIIGVCVTLASLSSLIRALLKNNLKN